MARLQVGDRVKCIVSGECSVMPHPETHSGEKHLKGHPTDIHLKTGRIISIFSETAGYPEHQALAMQGHIYEILLDEWIEYEGRRFNGTVLGENEVELVP